MESYIRSVMLLAGAGLSLFVVFIIIRNLLRKDELQVSTVISRRPDEDAYSRFSMNASDSNMADPEVAHTFSTSTQVQKPVEDTLLVLSVMAKPGARFASYDLLQAISAAGLQFGEMNIFHYVYPEASYGIKLFSLVSAEEPGEFNIDNMGEFSCPGLMLFMDSARVPDPDAAFRIMLEKAERLAEDLDGELRADPKTPWNHDIQQRYQNRVAQCLHHPVL